MRRTGTAVALDVVGSAAVLVLLSLTWQRVRIDRDAPFADIATGLSGRGVAPAAFGLALVTLAGAVAALATRGLARRLVGVVVVLAGAGTVVVALTALHAAGDARARSLAATALADRTSAAAVVPIRDGTVAVSVQAVWPVLTVVAAVLSVVAGVLWLLPAATRAAGAPAGLGPRYEAPVAAERPRDATWWSAMDHGEDPTTAPPGAAPDPASAAAEPEPHTGRDTPTT